MVNKYTVLSLNCVTIVLLFKKSQIYRLKIKNLVLINMAKILKDISRTFKEFLIVPGLTDKVHSVENIDLKTPLVKYKKGLEESKFSLNIPFVSAAMQAVSGQDLAIRLARSGGLSFIFSSQSIEDQAEMVRVVKEHKAGFVKSDSNLSPENTLQDALDLKKKTGHSTIAITKNGEMNSKLLGILTDKDFWEFKDDLNSTIQDYFTPLEKLILGKDGISLAEAIEILWKNKKECLPIIDSSGNLVSLVFRKDYYDHKSYPDEIVDDNKRLIVAAALNTHDYIQRAKVLIGAGADLFCLDSSDGYSHWQDKAIKELKQTYPDIVLGAGNVVSKEGFDYLVKSGADFVKIGIGGGSICTTRSQKAIGRGQASALIEVVQRRDEYFKETGIYVPVCSDGGLNSDTDIIVALALGSDFVMMGRYFAMCSESPTTKITFKGLTYKPYWGEGAFRAKNWQRYKQKDNKLVFEEGVDAFVPLSGPLSEKVAKTVIKIKSAMCNIGVLNIEEFHKNSVLTQVSEMTLVESGTSSVQNLDREIIGNS